MIRRSKIKVRPAIKKPSPQGTTSSRPSTQKPSSGSPSLSAQNKASPTSDLDASVPPTVSAAVHTHDAEKSVPLSATGNDEKCPDLAKKVGNSVSADSSVVSSNKTPAKPQMARRRKLVACPTMARKKVKTSNPKPKADLQNDSIGAPKETAITALPPTHTNTWASETPELNDVPALPAPLEPNVTEVDDVILQEKSATEFATLSTVTSLSLAEEEVVENNSNDKSLDTSEGTIASINVTVGASETMEAQGNSEASQPSADQAINGVQMVGKDVQTKATGTASATVQNSKLGIPHNNLVKKTTPKPKLPSATMKHKNSAMAKLKKLKEGQEDSEKWPELDQNVVSMSDLIFLNPPDTVGFKLGMNVRREDAERERSQREKTPEPEPSTSTQEEGEDSALPVPQIRIAEDGSVVIDEESLVVDTRKPPQRIAHDTVYEIGREGMINQCSFLKRPHARPSRWSQQETDKFYRCLCIVGAEFTLMGAMFGGRSADDLRRKFKRERKVNPARVDKALMQQHLSKWTDDMFEPKGTCDNGNKAITVTRPAEETVK